MINQTTIGPHIQTNGRVPSALCPGLVEILYFLCFGRPDAKLPKVPQNYPSFQTGDTQATPEMKPPMTGTLRPLMPTLISRSLQSEGRIITWPACCCWQSECSRPPSHCHRHHTWARVWDRSFCFWGRTIQGLSLTLISPLVTIFDWLPFLLSSWKKR